MNSLELAKTVEKDVIDLRRAIHQFPELSAQEVETQKKVIKVLEQLEIPYEKVGNTSTIAYIKGTKKGIHKTIALRADIDALPMQEETDITFKSDVDGVSHMCGHDAHTAMLLGAAMLLQTNRDSFCGTVKLFFQEAEEILAGATKIIEAGGMKDVEMIFALHCLEAFYPGEIAVMSGYQLSGGTTINMHWTGVSGHGATPHKSKDSIHAAAVFVSNMQSIVTKNVSPLDVAALSIGKFHGGTVANIISKYTDLALTFRYYKPEVRDAVKKALLEHAKGVSMMYEVDVDVQMDDKVNATYNDPIAVDKVKTAFTKFADSTSLKQYEPIMSSEDFSEYLKHAPGCMAWLGIRNEQQECVYYPHHEKFKIDESALKYGVALLFQIAIDYFADENPIL